MRKVLSVSWVLFAFSATHADSAALRENLTQNLGFMKSVYKSGYAPALWKERFAGWNLNAEIDRALQATHTRADLDLAGAREILKTFIYSMKDYHTSISFLATEKASLPFMVKSAGGKYFLAYIDRAKLPEDSFPFSVGDELVTFSGRPTDVAVAAVQAEITANVAETDHELAEMRLTRRAAARGYRVPKGAVMIGVRPQGASAVRNFEMIWDYTAEGVSHPKAVAKASSSTLPAPRLVYPMMNLDADTAANPFDLGARKAFTPALGRKIWQTSETDLFDAYIYQDPARKLIGYVRISDYVPVDSAKSLEAFAKIIALFESTTDGMVIDQVNNPGGSVFYLYTLASMLSDQPLYTPLHRMTIMQSDIVDALKNIDALAKVTDDASAKKIIGDDGLDGYPVSYEVAQFLLSYFRMLVSEWNAGRTLSTPYWIAGVNHINPAPTVYTKPIVVLVNALDFSGGDFFPAILQDNKRVVIFGTRTAGAGGYVSDVSYPNSLGIRSFRYTGSIASRIDDNPIENLGVKPDVPYTLTQADFEGGFRDYVKAIQATIGSLVR